MGMCWQKIHELREIQRTGHLPETPYEASQKGGGSYPSWNPKNKGPIKGPYACKASISLRQPRLNGV